MAKCPPPKKKEHRWRIVRLRTCLPFGEQLPLALILLAAAIISAFKTTGSHPVPSKLSHELFITENTMWRGLCRTALCCRCDRLLFCVSQICGRCHDNDTSILAVQHSWAQPQPKSQASPRSSTRTLRYSSGAVRP